MPVSTASVERSFYGRKTRHHLKYLGIEGPYSLSDNAMASALIPFGGGEGGNSVLWD